MKKQLSTILKFFFFLGIGILLIWLAVKDKTDVELQNILQSVRHADYFWICLSVVISALSHYFRAVRWRMLLFSTGYSPTVSNTFFAVMVGYLANCALPRLGEVSRCGILSQYEKVPFTVGFGSVIAERALDVLCLIAMFFLMLALEFDRIAGISDRLVFSVIAQKAELLNQNKEAFFIILISLLLFTSLLVYYRKKISNLFSVKVKAFFGGLWDGLRSLKNLKSPFAFSIYTILIWLMYILQVYICFFAFKETSSLNFGAAVVIMVFGSLGIAVVPGGTGAYQYILILILTSVYFIDPIPAFAFAWAVWASQIILILFLGLLSLILLPLVNKKSIADLEKSG